MFQPCSISQGQHNPAHRNTAQPSTTPTYLGTECPVSTLHRRSITASPYNTTQRDAAPPYSPSPRPAPSSHHNSNTTSPLFFRSARSQQFLVVAEISTHRFTAPPLQNITGATQPRSSLRRNTRASQRNPESSLKYKNIVKNSASFLAAVQLHNKSNTPSPTLRRSLRAPHCTP